MLELARDMVYKEDVGGAIETYHFLGQQLEEGYECVREGYLYLEVYLKQKLIWNAIAPYWPSVKFISSEVHQDLLDSSKNHDVNADYEESGICLHLNANDSTGSYLLRSFIISDHVDCIIILRNNKSKMREYVVLEYAGRVFKAASSECLAAEAICLLNETYGLNWNLES